MDHKDKIITAREICYSSGEDFRDVLAALLEEQQRIETLHPWPRLPKKTPPTRRREAVEATRQKLAQVSRRTAD